MIKQTILTEKHFNALQDALVCLSIGSLMTREQVGTVATVAAGMYGSNVKETIKLAETMIFFQMEEGVEAIFLN